MGRIFSNTEIARKTFFFDNWRCFCSGFMDSLTESLALVMAIRVFQAPNWVKSFIFASSFVGNFFTVITQSLATRQRRYGTMDFSTIHWFIVSFLVFASIWATSAVSFLFLISFAIIFSKQPIPLMEDVYGQNYSPQERGSRLAITLNLLLLSTMVFGQVGGKLMDLNLQNYRLALLLVSLAAIGTALSFSRIPSRVLPVEGKKSMASSVKIIFTDKQFGMALLWWSLSGIGIQMMGPLRTEYLMDNTWGIGASNTFVVLVSITIPVGFRILSTFVCGQIFHRFNFIAIKLMVNLFLMASVLLFFNTKTKFLVALASACTGIARGGGEIIWCLWVTKIVPKEKFSLYMGLNVAVTGLRGLLSPFLGYGICQYLSLAQMSYFSATLVLISSFGFFSLIKHPRFATISPENS
ncbi:MAG: MFS transporter [Puniceicoccales bacterium]|nr:MFS transporter [Puniceicoccales bacterium]